MLVAGANSPCLAALGRHAPLLSEGEAGRWSEFERFESYSTLDLALERVEAALLERHRRSPLPPPALSPPAWVLANKATQPESRM